MNEAQVFSYYFGGFSSERPFEWKVVEDAKPKFQGHRQPRRPKHQRLSDDEASVVAAVRQARDAGIDGFVFLFYWDNGKVYHNEALEIFCKYFADDPNFQFSILWVNRRLHTEYPILQTCSSGFYSPSEDRRVKTDLLDFGSLFSFLRINYTCLSNYLKLSGKPVLQIYDTQEFIYWARRLEDSSQRDFRDLVGEMTFVATLPDMNPTPWFSEVKTYFDLTTSYVLLPDFLGAPIQCYRQCCKDAQDFWTNVQELTGVPNMPAVTVGWDATPRGDQTEPHEFGDATSYPNSPVVVGSTPEAFQMHLIEALRVAQALSSPIVNISSFNEWSEGHALEPDDDFGSGYLDAVRVAVSSSILSDKGKRE